MEALVLSLIYNYCIFMKYQFLANYGKLVFLTVVKGYTDSYAGFVAVSDDISSKTDHARFISK